MVRPNPIPPLSTHGPQATTTLPQETLWLCRLQSTAPRMCPQSTGVPPDWAPPNATPTLKNKTSSFQLNHIHNLDRFLFSRYALSTQCLQQPNRGCSLGGKTLIGSHPMPYGPCKRPHHPAPCPPAPLPEVRSSLPARQMPTDFQVKLPWPRKLQEVWPRLPHTDLVAQSVRG